MKHAVSSPEFINQTRGFRHGAGGIPMDERDKNIKEYQKGYTDGQHARRIYSECICKEMGMVNPKIQIA